MLLCGAAASAGHEGVVQLLLEAGADVNARTKRGCSALHYTASKGHIRVAKILIEAGSHSQLTVFLLLLHTGYADM
jgi:ankyrin repeat protein